MKWEYLPLKEVAPVRPSQLRFEDEDMIWHLTIDQIEAIQEE